MGLFSRILGNRRRQEENWAFLFVKIAKELAAVRETWFEGCVGVFEEARAASPPIETRIVNRTFGRPVDLPIKAYQLMVAIPFLMASYFPRVEAKVGDSPPGLTKEEGVTDAFYACIAGPDLSETAVYMRRYEEASQQEGQRGTSLITFSGDVARYIAGDDPLPSESMLLWPHVGVFIALTKMVVANAFGDNAKVKRLGASLRDLANMEEQQESQGD